MKYYIVSIGDFEYYKPVIVFGEPVKNWKSFCDNIIKNIVKNLSRKEITLKIFEQLLISLEGLGYKQVKFDEANYFEGDKL